MCAELLNDLTLIGSVCRLVGWMEPGETNQSGPTGRRAGLASRHSEGRAVKCGEPNQGIFPATLVPAFCFLPGAEGMSKFRVKPS
jgi:hypothetical protein